MKANDPTLPVTHKDMPRFLYPEGHVLDLNDEADRLFEGHYIKYVSPPLFLVAKADITYYIRYYNICIQHPVPLAQAKSLAWLVLGPVEETTPSEWESRPSTLVPSRTLASR